MLRELLEIFWGGEPPIAKVGENFAKMLRLAFENTLASGEIYFGNRATPEARTQIYDKDIEVNKLERRIRKQIVAHLAVKGNYMDVPYCLMMNSMIKDVERLGDYAKNLAEVVDIYPETLPDDEIIHELREIRREVEGSFDATSQILSRSDRERALELIRHGRDIAHRCDALITKNARSHYDAATTTAIVLGTRYYKRIGGHVLNILSSVVMPLHKIDFYDEDAVMPADPVESDKKAG